MRRLCVQALLLAFLFSAIGPLPAQADGSTMLSTGEFVLPKPGTRVHLSPAFNPPILRGIKVHPDNAFRFDFILDNGDGSPSAAQLKQESNKLIKYFLASLTIPEKDLWVNLSPYEKDRIVPEAFGQTEMGRDLLAEDYLLKQITASLIYPEDETGKNFWKRVYQEAGKKFGSTSIPVSTFNKVWIMPQKAVVYENAQAGTAFVVESKLKVMLEQDYLAIDKNAAARHGAVKPTGQAGEIGSRIVREIVIPALEKEVNEGKNFYRLRQVYGSLILAAWYKRKIKDSLIDRVYVDKNKIAGVTIPDPKEKQRIYARYLEAFKKGAYNIVKEEQNPLTRQITPRKYFSGGAEFTDMAMSAALDIKISASEHMALPRHGDLQTLQVKIEAWQEPKRDQAMTVDIEDMLVDPLDLPVKEVIQWLGIERISEMAVRAQLTSRDSLTGTLRALREVFTTPDRLVRHWDDIIAMGSEAGFHGAELFEQGLPRVREMFNSYEEFDKHWKDLVGMVEAAGPSSWGLFSSGLPAMRLMFDSRDEFLRHWGDLSVMVKAAGRSSSDLFARGMPVAREALGSKEAFNRHWSDLVVLVSASGADAYTLFVVGLPAARKVFGTTEELERYWEGLMEMGTADVAAPSDLFEYALPAVRTLFNTPEEFKPVVKALVDMEHATTPREKSFFIHGLPAVVKFLAPWGGLKKYWKDVMEMVKVAGPNAGSLFGHEFVPALSKREIRTPEDFDAYWSVVVEAVKTLGVNAADVFRYGLPAKEQAGNDYHLWLVYARKLAKILPLMSEEQVKSFFALSAQADIGQAPLEKFDVGSRFGLVKFLLSFSPTPEEKRQILAELLEPYTFTHPEELTMEDLSSLWEAYKDEEEVRYFLYYVAINTAVHAEVRHQAEVYLSERKLFRVQEDVAASLKSGRKKVLVVHNIKDGQGDELIRMGSFLQGLLAYNPQIEITVISNRAYLYDNPRVHVSPVLGDEQEWSNWEGWSEHYDAVIDHFGHKEIYSHTLDNALEKSGVIERASIYVRTSKMDEYFAVDEVRVNGRDYASSLGVDHRRANNVYEPSFRLAAEFGLPIRPGEEVPAAESLIVGNEYPGAAVQWQNMMSRAGNTFHNGRFEHPVVLFNPFGGEAPEKGFDWGEKKAFRRTIEHMIGEGYKVVILPNGAPWGTKRVAERMREAMSPSVQENCVVAENPSVDPRAFKYYASFSDIVVTVEGGFMHLAYNMGSPFAVILRSGAGPVKWVPYGRMSRQGVVTEESLKSQLRHVRHSRARFPGGTDQAMTSPFTILSFKSTLEGTTLLEEIKKRHGGQVTSIEVSGQPDDVVRQILERTKNLQDETGVVLTAVVDAPDGDRMHLMVSSKAEDFNDEDQVRGMITNDERLPGDLLIIFHENSEHKLIYFKYIEINDSMRMQGLMRGVFRHLYATILQNFKRWLITAWILEMTDSRAAGIFMDSFPAVDEEKTQEGIEGTQDFVTSRYEHSGVESSAIRVHRIATRKPFWQIVEESRAAKAQAGKERPDAAMAADKKGGIDLTSDASLSIQNSGKGIQFHMDPAQLKQLQNAPGFTPVIINIQPMTDLRLFLGLKRTAPGSSAG